MMKKFVLGAVLAGSSTLVSIAAAQSPATAPPAPPSAIMAGFETLSDGATRFYVELSKPVAYEAKAALTTVTYVLKGARVDRRNNQNPLITVHFNTPATSARLVPHGRDLWFVVDLRANVQPTVSLDSSADGEAALRITFPKGTYLPPEKAEPAPVPSEASGEG